MKILILHGPNLNLTGTREPDVYGNVTLEEINTRLAALGRELGAEVTCRQSNHEGVLIDALHEARTGMDGVVLNAGGCTHTSVALRDAVAAIAIPVVEVHMSNIYAREEFRHTSLLAPVCRGSICGFGWQSYALGLRAVIDQIKN